MSGRPWTTLEDQVICMLRDGKITRGEAYEKLDGERSMRAISTRLTKVKGRRPPRFSSDTDLSMMLALIEWSEATGATLRECAARAVEVAAKRDVEDRARRVRGNAEASQGLR